MPVPRRSSAPCGCESDHVSAGGGPTPPIEPAGAGLLVPVKLSCDGVEVTQAIQDMPHSVPLIANKRTVVRVYLSAATPSALTVQGMLKVRRAGSHGKWRFVPSLGPVTILPAENGHLRLKRENESKSLNFILPASTTSAGSWDIRLALAFQTAPYRLLLPPHDARRTATFVASPPLRVRIIGIRFQPGAVQPSPLDFTLIRSWLERAYPVASIEWSQVTVDGPLPWPFFASDINAFVRGIRTTDVLGGVDARTHYYGLVSDGGGGFFMRGLASGIPGMPDPSTVASGPTGVNTWGWDTDGSYGDWYTGHEFGHTFGRFHAEFCGAGGGAPYPFVNGQLSNADGAFVGFDVGDPANGLAVRALPGPIWHDVMSYCSFQWLSSFTYTGIRDRLVQEDALPAGAVPPLMAGGPRARRGRSTAMAKSSAIHVVATLNLTRATGRLQHVTPVPAVPAGQRALKAARTGRGMASLTPGGQAALRLIGARDKVLGEFPATIIPDACLNPGDDVTGIVDAFLPAANASRLELVLNSQVVDTFTPTGQARPVASVRAERPARRRGEPAPADEDRDPVITWTEAGRRAAAPARAVEEGPRYTVQVSADGGVTWQTVGFGLREPRVTLDRELLGDAETVKIRITSTNGFRSASTETQLKVSELNRS